MEDKRDVVARNSILKVDAISGNAGLYPHIRLKGRWLERLGWKIGSEVHVRAKKDSIIIMRCPVVGGIQDERGDDSSEVSWSECVLRAARKMLSANHSGQKREIKSLALNLLALSGQSDSRNHEGNGSWESIKNDLRLVLATPRDHICCRHIAETATSEVHDGPAMICPCLAVLEEVLRRISK